MADYEGLDPNFAKSLQAMVNASGGRLRIVSAFRTEEEQARLWNDAVRDYGEEEARWWVAPPGHSNHNKGLAADLEGDLPWAHENAARFGLWFPLSNEEWHVEPLGSRGESNEIVQSGAPRRAGSTPAGESEVVAESRLSTPASGDPMAMLLTMLGLNSVVPGTQISMPSLPGFTTPQSGLGDGKPTSPMMTQTAALQDTGRYYAGGLSDLDKFMAAVREVESGGDYTVQGPSTPWGTAKGAYQFLDSTWDGYGGYGTAAEAPPEVQDERARTLMGDAFGRYGSWANVAAMWYAGPDQNRWAWEETQTYMAKVMAAMARQG